MIYEKEFILLCVDRIGLPSNQKNKKTQRYVFNLFFFITYTAFLFQAVHKRVIGIFLCYYIMLVTKGRVQIYYHK